MDNIIKRVRESLYQESNEDLTGGETPTGDDFDSDDENDLDADSVCANLDEEGYCTTGAECSEVSAGDTCPYLDDFGFKDCCGFCGISDDTSSFGADT